jgi:DNA polymerase-3 subunit alpha
MIDEAKEVYDIYSGAFDEFYLELPMIEMDMQVEANRRIIQFAKEVGAKLVISLDSHYLLPEHSETHDLLLLIKDRKTIKDKIDNPEEVWQFNVKNLYYRLEDDVRGLFERMYKDDIFTEEVFNEAMMNTRMIALNVDDIKLDSNPRLPKLSDDSNQLLSDKAKEGFRKKKLKGKTYCDRLSMELEVICNMGFADYFLIVEKMVSEATKRFGSFATGYGRGSASGSIVAYCLDITAIDPIKYGLLFERFLDYSRGSIWVNSFEV